MNPHKNILASFLVLDYNKPDETKLCLESIRANANFPHEIIYLDNGSAKDYCFDFYKQGLCDIFISKRRGMGGGFGQTDLFRFCDSKYAFFVQSDQFLVRKLGQEHVEYFINLLQQGFNCIDLNGDQSNRGVWTDRGHFIDVDYFNSLAPFPNGGPGEFHHLRWNENYLQEKVDKIAHLNFVAFADNGVYTIRELPDGSIVKMKTDTKEVSWIKNPKQKYIFPELTDEEWDLSINGKWIDKTIPVNYKAHSFKCWK